MAKFTKGQRVRLARTLQYGTIHDVFSDDDKSKYSVVSDAGLHEFTQLELRHTFWQLFVILVNYLFNDMESLAGIRRCTLTVALLSIITGFFLGHLLSILF